MQYSTPSHLPNESRSYNHVMIYKQGRTKRETCKGLAGTDLGEASRGSGLTRVARIPLGFKTSVLNAVARINGRIVFLQ
ncbi:hypothetical protein PVK06_032554 [Gossypium arboreum]|uniref:Uncharacterized protein n=1 Tax=Gossypium arboreum TaxID=29729 RepID=A0ABR0NU60_GOSAR|nr:hypothetical protein PVK06_032554 [Gossypium arboreum]